MFLNSIIPFEGYKDIARSKFFVDKTLLINEIISAIAVETQRYICITRPRRFGKSVVAHMIGAFFGKAAEVRLQGYAATSAELNTKNQIYSAMVVYGLLTYEEGEVFIPNRELMDKFNELLLSNDNLGYIYNLAKESEKCWKPHLQVIQKQCRKF